MKLGAGNTSLPFFFFVLPADFICVQVMQSARYQKHSLAGRMQDHGRGEELGSTRGIDTLFPCVLTWFLDIACAVSI